MAALIAPGICRYAVHSTYGGRNLVNIMDMRIDTTGSTLSRVEAIEDVANDILSNWDDHLQPTLVNECVLQKVSWVDLDDEDGSTGEVNESGAHVWPRAGASADPDMPGSVSVLVTKVAPGGGRATRNGRLYLSGLGEGITDANTPNSMSAATVAALQARFNAIHAGIHDTGVVGDSSRFPVVVHTKNVGTVSDPEIVFVSASEVTSFVVQSQLATQRRRMRG